MSWRKPSRSHATGSCVEVSVATDGVRVRNSRDKDGPVLVFTRDEWAAFCAGVRGGEFDVTP